MKNGRAYIPPLVIFVGISSLVVSGETKIFADICLFLRTQKNAIIRLFVLFCGLIE